MAKAKSHVLPVEFRVASPESVTLAGVGEVMAYPLNIRDLGTIRLEAKKQGRLREQELCRTKLNFLKEIGEDTPDAKKEVLAFHHLRIDTGSSEAAWMLDYEGTAFSVWMMLRKDQAHTDITLEQVRDGILHFNIDYWQNLIDRLSYPPTPEDDDESDDDEDDKQESKETEPNPNDGTLSSPQSSGTTKKETR